MGAKTWMLVYSQGPAKDILKSRPMLNREKTLALAQELFPDHALEPIEDGSLDYTSPPRKDIYAGCFEGLIIIAAKEFQIDYPSRLPSRFLDIADGMTVHLHYMYSIVDWFAFALWENATLTRSLGVSPDTGVKEDIGERLAFEEPFWAGKHPVGEPGDEGEYPLNFHPLELGEAALESFFGYVMEGYPQPDHVQPEEITLMGFRRKARQWWKFW